MYRKAQREKRNIAPRFGPSHVCCAAATAKYLKMRPGTIARTH